MGRLSETARWVVTEYGDLGLFLGLFLEFLGLPFPGEITQSFAGFWISQGHLRWEVTLAACLAGSIGGSMAAHVIGRKYGQEALHCWGPRCGLKLKYIVKAESWFEKNRIAMILLSRYVVGVRHVTPYFTGIVGMGFWEALAWNLLGSLIWCIPLIGLGYFAGQAYEILFRQFHRYATLIALALILLSTAVYLFYRRQSQKGQEIEMDVETQRVGHPD